ncbi:hypothetical protein CCUS01_11209 [Colletotrichum cuscutae]|uniref:Uncharacterized protein n=1 Tax=Colletotrichum cuscutae TaxID=1209917 RepID=A0AAI9XIS2_9PEZI|nr:hypothetical protein CCUS01_11209 [Colletotrichum cuscutae]
MDCPWWNTTLTGGLRTSPIGAADQMLATRLEVKDYMAMLFTALRNIAAAPRRRAQSLEPFSDCTGPCSHSKKSTAIVTHGVFDDYSAFGRLSYQAAIAIGIS